MENDSKPAGEWRVVRQDTHGNRFEMAKGLSEEFARRMADEYAARGHKQTYWAEKMPPRPTPSI